MEYCTSLGGVEFYYSTRSGNSAAKALALSYGFIYQYAEQKTDLRSGKPYELEIYRKALRGSWISNVQPPPGVSFSMIVP